MAQNPSLFTPEQIAENLGKDEDLPYGGRAAQLLPVVRYLLWAMRRAGSAVA